MSRTHFSHSRTTTIARNLCIAISAIGLLAGALFVEAVPPAISLSALPLPMDQSIHGFARPQEPALYAVEATVPGFLIVEAQGTPPANHEVRILGHDGRLLTDDARLPAIEGRHVQQVATTGTYFVEITASSIDAKGFRLFAWMADRPGNVQLLEPMDETDESGSGPQLLEPMDETDEGYGGSYSLEPMDETDEGYGGSYSLEPMDETDELAGPAQSWREIPGYGLLRLTAEGRLHRHSWCPWAERPELLSTFTCARQLRADETRTITVSPISPAGFEIIGLELATAGRVTLEAAGGLDAAVFDAGGRQIIELAAGEPTWFEAGLAYLRIETQPGGEAVVLDVEID